MFCFSGETWINLPVVDEVEEEGQLHPRDGEGQGEGGGGVGGDKVGQEGGGGSQDEPVAGNLQQKYQRNTFLADWRDAIHGIC